MKAFLPKRTRPEKGSLAPMLPTMMLSLLNFPREETRKGMPLQLHSPGSVVVEVDVVDEVLVDELGVVDELVLLEVLELVDVVELELVLLDVLVLDEVDELVLLDVLVVF
jgi:hypothetical protein